MVTTSPLTEADIWRALQEVPDPEIPVVSVVEMGIVRSVQLSGDGVTVSMTPTFAGCPALDFMRSAIQVRLQALGLARVEVQTVLHPPWTSDWISEAARDKLKAFGLAPPPRHGGNVELFFLDQVACPYCGSHETRIKNSFGSTLCRAIFYCNHCRQPFEQFKPL
jgi:ring-1,2-phenylacetyl-CoA epoxidase subunit PaaD